MPVIVVDQQLSHLFVKSSETVAMREQQLTAYWAQCECTNEGGAQLHYRYVQYGEPWRSFLQF